MLYRIEVKRGTDWDAGMVGEPNRFASEQEAYAALSAIAGEDTQAYEYRVSRVYRFCGRRRE